LTPSSLGVTQNFNLEKNNPKSDLLMSKRESVGKEKPYSIEHYKTMRVSKSR